MELLERRHDLELLTSLVEATADGTGSVALVSGQAGIGKSALVDALVAGLDSSVTVLHGGCDDLATPRVMGPVADIAFASGDRALTEALRDGDSDQVLARLVEILSAGPSVLIFEDLHWADDATLDTVRVLSRYVASLPSVLLLTFRDDEIGHGHPLRQALGSLRGDHVTRLSLGPLSVAAVRQLAEGSGLNADDLFAITGGNPFFVGEVLASPDVTVPESVRDSVLRRIEQLDEEPRRLVEALSVIPSRVEREIAHDLAGQRRLDPIATLTALERAGILIGDAEGIWFRHELSRRAVESDLTATQRSELNLLALGALASRDVDPARQLHHAEQANDAEAVIALAPHAVDRAVRLGSHRQAARHLAVYLRYRERLQPAEIASALTTRSYSLYLINQIEEAFDVGSEAVAACRALSDRGALAEALVVLARGALWARGPRSAEQAALEAVRLLEHDDERSAQRCAAYAGLARARSNLATIGSVARPSDLALDAALHALDLAGRLGRDDLRSQALIYVGSCRLANGDPDGHRDLAEAVELAAVDHRIEYRLRALVNASGSMLRDGDPDGAIEWATGGLESAADGEFYAGEYRLALTRADALIATGDWARAEAELTELTERPGEPGIMRPLALSLLARLRARRGADVAELLERARALLPGIDDSRVVGPLVAAELEAAWLAGRTDAMGGIAASALRLADGQHDLLTIGELTRYLQRAGHRVEAGAEPPGPWAPAVAGDWEAAASAWEAIRNPYEASIERLQSDDPAQIERALGVLDGLGATTAAAIARQRLRELGVVSIPRGPNRATRESRLGLTARQQEVLVLLGEDLTNAQIAGRLHISTRTVDRHVAAIFDKLGVNDRKQAARAATVLRR